MLSLGFIFAFIGAAVALLIGVIIFVEREDSNFIWIVISLLPLICFVLLYRFNQIFGFFKKIFITTQTEFDKAQGWKGASDFNE